MSSQNKIKIDGFTLIEIIVVLGVISLLASYLIVYNKINANQIQLTIDQSVLVETINKAKALSMSTYISGGAPCGYGVIIKYPQSYALFKYGSSTQVQFCQNIASSSIDTDSPNYIEIEKYNLSSNILFEQRQNYMNIIFFVPPDPQVLIWKDGSGLAIKESDSGFESYIYLKTNDGSFRKIIKVNVAGQISF